MHAPVGSIGEDGFLWFETYEEFSLWCEAQAEALRDDASLGEDDEIDALTVAERLGFRVYEVDKVPGGSGYRSGRGGNKLFIERDIRPERKQFTVLREIAELRIREKVNPEHLHFASSAIAACLLMPGRTFSWDGQMVNWDLAALKRQYPAASYEAISRRIPPFKACVVTVTDQGRVGPGGRFGSIAHPPEMAETEIRAMQTLLEKQTDEGDSILIHEHVDTESGLSVRAWGVFSGPHKRVIIMTEADEFAE